MVDGEGSISKIKSELNSMGMEVDVSGAGRHVKRVERRSQVVKERVKAHSSPPIHTTSHHTVHVCTVLCIQAELPAHTRAGPRRQPT